MFDRAMFHSLAPRTRDLSDSHVTVWSFHSMRYVEPSVLVLRCVGRAPRWFLRSWTSRLWVRVTCWWCDVNFEALLVLHLRPQPELAFMIYVCFQLLDFWWYQWLVTAWAWLGVRRAYFSCYLWRVNVHVIIISRALGDACEPIVITYLPNASRDYGGVICARVAHHPYVQ